jgi:hypothetical protein
MHNNADFVQFGVAGIQGFLEETGVKRENPLILAANRRITEP